MWSLLAMTLSAHAGSSPGERQAVVTLVTLGGEVAGAVAGGAAGLGIGSASCRPGAFECWGPFFGVGVGVPVGALIGGPVAGALSAKAYGVRPGRALAFGAGGLAIGVGATALGVLVDSAGSNQSTFTLVGIGAAAVLPPILAGVGARTAPVASDGPAISVAPMSVRGGGGVQVAVFGF
jgi:hypothetical protein